MSLEEFFDSPKWGSVVEKQVRLRIKLCVAAYAYECENTSIITDAEFDGMCLLVDLKVATGNKKIDTYFKRYFDHSTGQWIHKHPELNKIRNLYQMFYKKEV
jgi:hypothetical protein